MFFSGPTQRNRKRTGFDRARGLGRRCACVAVHRVVTLRRMSARSPRPPAIPDAAVEWRAIRSPGPGGQNVNKVATAIQLRIHLAKAGLAPAVRLRLETLAGRRISGEGVLLIEANRFRSQERNRADAWERLEALLLRALIKPKRRIPTRVPTGERQQRMEDKRRRGTAKRLRRDTRGEE